MIKKLDKDSKIIGNNIRRIREEKNMTLRDLGNKVNIAFSNLARYERGEVKMIPISMIKQLASALDVPINEITKGSIFQNTNDYDNNDIFNIPKDERELNKIINYCICLLKEKGATDDEIKELLKRK